MALTSCSNPIALLLPSANSHMEPRSTDTDAIEQSLPDPQAHPGQSRQGLLYVCIAVIFFGTSPIFVRWSGPFSAVEIAFWRLTIAAIMVAALGLITRQRLFLKRGELPRFVFYGFVTALHFFFYV